jgi:hypothetical protein
MTSHLKFRSDSFVLLTVWGNAKTLVKSWDKCLNVQGDYVEKFFKTVLLFV